jgi:hypothetical protein
MAKSESNHITEAQFNAGLKRLLSVSKHELDARLKRERKRKLRRKARHAHSRSRVTR